MEYNYIEKRYNVMGLSSIGAFAGIKGGMNGNCKDVYFLRVTGANATFVRDVENMDHAQTGKMLLGQGIYNRVGAFPKNIGTEVAGVYADCYQKWEDSGRTRLFTRRLEEKDGVGELLGASCRKVLEVYRGSNPNLNVSIEKNFVVKLLFWLDELAYEFLRAWNPRQSMKFVAQSVTKEQEYFFCYFLTLLGIDVLLLQNETDIDERMAKLNLSRVLVLGEKKAVELEGYDRQKYVERRNTAGGSGGQIRAGAGASQRPRITLPPHRRGSSGTMGSAGEQRTGSGEDTGAGRQERIEVGNGSGGMETGAANSTGGTRSGAGRPGGMGAGNSTGGMRSGAGRQELNFEELAQLASSVVMIAIHDNRGEVIGSGSGIMIGREGYILTNNHVARGGYFYSVRIENDDHIYKTDEIIKYNSVLDLAVIRIERRLEPLQVYRGSKPLVRGQKVVAIGSPLGLFNSVSDGIISGFRRMDDVDMIQFTAPTSHGSSGGAVLNMYGEVIGVSTAGIDEGQNINLAVGYEFINTFIKGFQ